MGRAPCCEKMGMKRGPWTPEEDQILISHVQKYGHSNWRALPKQAGLLRCGKSCRLRWINYLRPDIKRGNFSQEEEETIIKLHEMLGNRWSAIAAKLPGRTDNEIKNVWHTHLKKILEQKHEPRKQCMAEPTIMNPDIPNHPGFQYTGCTPTSPQPSSVDDSSVTEETSSIDSIKDKNMDLPDALPLIDEELWLEPEFIKKSGLSSIALFDELQSQILFTCSHSSTVITQQDHCSHGPSLDDGMNFWYNLFIRSGRVEDIPQLR